MNTINNVSATVAPLPQPAARTSTPSDNANADQPPTTSPSTVVVISPEGKAKAAEEQQKNADIDAAALPDSIKETLKAIRDLQQKIDKKNQELQEVMNDQSLSAKERDEKSKGIQMEISVLSSTLRSVTSDMIQEESALGLKSPQRQLAGSLVQPQ